MSAAAQLVYQSGRYDNMTLLLYRLLWLHAPERVMYKLSVLVYKCVHGLASAYLADVLRACAGHRPQQWLYR